MHRNLLESLSGDSGSWILNASGEVIGLLFAGSLSTPETYMLPIEAVGHDIIARLKGRSIMYPIVELDWIEMGSTFKYRGKRGIRFRYSWGGRR